MAPHRIDLRDHRDADVRVGLDGGDGGTQPGGATSDDDDVVADDFDQGRTSCERRAEGMRGLDPSLPRDRATDSHGAFGAARVGGCRAVGKGGA